MFELKQFLEYLYTKLKDYQSYMYMYVIININVF